MGIFTKTVIKEVIKEVVPEDVRDLHKNPYTEEELLTMLVALMHQKYGDRVDKKLEREVFDKIAEVDGVADYFRDTVGADIQRYYVASSPMEQLTIRGASARTLYFKGLLKKPSKKDMNVTRYAK